MSSGVKITMLGVNRLKERVAVVIRGAGKHVAIAVREGAYMVHKDASESLTAAGKSGRVYQLAHPKREHQASAPGEAPASDTGQLRQGLVVVMDTDGMGASVISRAPYSAALEFGRRDGKIQARPFMGTAYLKNKADISRLIKAAYKKAIAEGGA